MAAEIKEKRSIIDEKKDFRAGGTAALRAADGRGFCNCAAGGSGGNGCERGISVFGYAVDGRHDHTLQETMEAQGWTRTYYSFEGGLRWYEFEKTENGMQYVFELDSCDSVITYVSLSRSPVEAAAAE